MKNHGWPGSILLFLLWLLCHCGNGIGVDDGVAGSNNTQGPLVAPVPTESTIQVLSQNSTIFLSSTASKSTSGSTSSPIPTASVYSTDRSSLLSNTEQSKLSSKNKSSDGGGNFLLRATQLENDNEGVGKLLQSTERSPSSLSTSTASTTTEPTSSSISSSPATTTATASASSTAKFSPSTSSSSSFTAPTSMNSSAFVASIKSQQQHLQQQRSKLWAPHSHRADLLKKENDDMGMNSTENNISSRGSSQTFPFSTSPSSNSFKSNTNLHNEKVGHQQQQQTRSIRSIRLIANNNSSSTSSKSIAKISQFYHDESQQAVSEESSNLDESDERNENEAEGPTLFHVNNNKFSVISSIRHYRSRKSFARTRKSTNTNSGSQNGAPVTSSNPDSDVMMIAANNIQDRSEKNPAATANLKKIAKMPKTFSSKLSSSDEKRDSDWKADEMNVRDAFIHQMPQDEPFRGSTEGDEKTAQRYFGRVETRKVLHGKNEKDFPNGASRYGKIMDKPTPVTSHEQNGYSSSDYTLPPPLYEPSFFSENDEETVDPLSIRQGKRQNKENRPNSNNNRKSPTSLFNTRSKSSHLEGDKDFTLLQRINKTFLSRNSKTRQQQGQVGIGSRLSHNNASSFIIANLSSSKELIHDATDNIHLSRYTKAQENSRIGERQNARNEEGEWEEGESIGLASEPRKGIASYSSFVTSGTETNINTSSLPNYNWNPSNVASPSFFTGNKESKDMVKGPQSDTDYGVDERENRYLLPTTSTSSNENPSGVSPAAPIKIRKQQRPKNRDRTNGQFRQQNKERRKQKGTRKPSAVLNGPFSRDESGSESQANNFHMLQGEHTFTGSSSKLDGNQKPSQKIQSNFPSLSSDDADASHSIEDQERKIPHKVHETTHQHNILSSLSSQDRSSKGEGGNKNRRKQYDMMVGQKSSSNNRHEMRRLNAESSGKEELIKDEENSDLIEYFPRVESFPDSSYITSGDGSNDNLFDEYRPLGHEFYTGAESSDLLQDDDATPENASPLSGSELTPSSGTSTVTQRNKPDSDIVTRFLNIVESQHLLGENCTAGTDFNLGEGVVDRYAQERFRLEAEFAVNRANMLTRMWKYVNSSVLENEYLLHAMVMSMVEFDDDIFAGGNCYDQYQYKNYTLFCPFAFRYDGGTVLVKDLSLEYHYLGNNSEWFFLAKKNAEKIVQAYNQFNRGFHQFRINETAMTDPIPDEVLNVTYEDGKWSKPYFDCGGANIWMITYTVPFFGYNNFTKTYHFKGTSGIDIDLRRVDIDQCPLPDNSTELNIFAGSDKCKNATTMCVPISGLGFRRGSYRCVCKDGFYFPNVTSPHKYYNGTVLEEEYEKKFDSNDTNFYDKEGVFECLRCPVGCDSCVDDRPCVVSLNWLMRSAILILQCAIILMLPIVGLFTFKYSDVKVVRAASPVLLRFIVLGAFFIYCTILVMYPSPSVITCTLRVWLREIGFSLAYGALMLKTWRISVIFRVRSAKAIKITDLDLMKRLGIIVAMFTALLVIRTLVAPPAAIVSLTADDLKAWLCKTDWWDHSFTLMELSFLVWGIRLCIVVRKAPSEFNESKFISLAIYNEFLLSLFLNISMLFLQSPANPDLLYIIFFCHVQLTMTLLLCLIFGSKAYMVFRGQGKGSSGEESNRMPTSKFISKGRSGQGNKQLSAHNSTGGLHSSSTSTGPDPNFNSRLSEDVQEEFRRLYSQLEELKERNMRLGNRHLVAKIAAMQEAADNILQAPASQINGQSHTVLMQHQLSPGNHSGVINGSGSGNSFPSASTSGGGHSPHTKGKSPSAFGPLSDIQEENPLQSLSGGQVQSPLGPKVLETSIDIVIQSDSPSRKTAQELGDNEQENNLNNGFQHPLALGMEGDSANTISEKITHNKDTVSSSCQLTRNSSSDSSAYGRRKGESLNQDVASSSSTSSILKDQHSPETTLEGSEERAHSSALQKKNLNKQDNPKCVSIEENESNPTKQNLNKKSTSSPSSSPSKQQHSSKGPKSEKHHHQPSTCQKSGEKSSDTKAVNHKDAAAASGSTGGGNGSSQKIILDLDDKSRFTEEITV